MGRPKKQRVKEPPGARGSGADAAEKGSAAGPTEGAVVGGGGEEEPGGRAGAGIGSGETEALAVGEVGLAVDALSHVKSGDGLAGGVDERSRGRGEVACFSFPLGFRFLVDERRRVDSAWYPPEQRANRAWSTPLALAGMDRKPAFKKKICEETHLLAWI